VETEAVTEVDAAVVVVDILNDIDRHPETEDDANDHGRHHQRGPDLAPGDEEKDHQRIDGAKDLDLMKEDLQSLTVDRKHPRENPSATSLLLQFHTSKKRN